MTQPSRPTLHLRLSDQNDRDGEISLADLAKVAGETQRVVTRIARGMVDDRRQGPGTRDVVAATTLFLTGIGSGSIVLDLALNEAAQDTLVAEGMPIDLGQIALTIFVESLETLSADEAETILPVGIDDNVMRDLGDWLRVLRGYSEIAIDTELDARSFHANIAPKNARKRLRNAISQPSIPYISSSHQALTGRLYALNLRTGTFRIEDDARHSIRLLVPEDVRREAAQLINKRVRAIGKASLDDRFRLLSFDVAALEQLPELVDQRAFFERHELVAPRRPIAADDLALGIIPDLSDDEIDTFVAAFEAE